MTARFVGGVFTLGGDLLQRGRTGDTFLLGVLYIVLGLSPVSFGDVNFILLEDVFFATFIGIVIYSSSSDSKQPESRICLRLVVAIGILLLSLF